MHGNDYTKICLILAGMNLSRSSLKNIYERISITDLDDFINDVNDMKNIIDKNIIKSNDDDNVDIKYSSKKYNNSTDKINFVNKVEKRLIYDMKLSRVESVNLISKELSKRRLSTKIPSYNKISFSNWLLKILNLITESELLHVIYSIDNVNLKLSDWNLKNE